MEQGSRNLIHPDRVQSSKMRALFISPLPMIIIPCGFRQRDEGNCDHARSSSNQNVIQIFKKDIPCMIFISLFGNCNPTFSSVCVGAALRMNSGSAHTHWLHNRPQRVIVQMSYVKENEEGKNNEKGAVLLPAAYGNFMCAYIQISVQCECNSPMNQEEGEEIYFSAFRLSLARPSFPRSQINTLCV